VNRPFYAFGVLIAFLTLAMLAIGLSSRPAGQQPSAGGSGSGLPRRQPGVTMFVVRLPEEELDISLGMELALNDDAVASAAICGLGGQQPRHWLGSASSAASGDVFVKPTLWRSAWASEQESNAAEGLQFVSIQMADLAQSDTNETPLVTGYDAAFDRAMAESVSAFLPTTRAVEYASDAADPDDAEELVRLFDSLVRSESRQGEQKSKLSLLARRRWDYETQAIVLGGLNSFGRVFADSDWDNDWRAAAARIGLHGTNATDPHGPAWSDYTAWIGSKQGTVALQGVQIRTTAANWSRPRDLLLQIAVAGLNRVAELLHQMAGAWLDQAGERTARHYEPPIEPALQK
jgi:hypothetical protein